MVTLSHSFQSSFKTFFKIFIYLSFFFLWYWGLNSGPTPTATPPALFCDGYF
jgi:hypothetical protein